MLSTLTRTVAAHEDAHKPCFLASAVSSGWLLNFPDSHPQGDPARIESTNVVHREDLIFSGVKLGPYAVGEWHWDIPWRIKTNISGRDFHFATTRQQATSDANGKLRFQKVGAQSQEYQVIQLQTGSNWRQKGPERNVYFWN